jgi:hypothetical protein
MKADLRQVLRAVSPLVPEKKMVSARASRRGISHGLRTPPSPCSSRRACRSWTLKTCRSPFVDLLQVLRVLLWLVPGRKQPRSVPSRRGFLNHPDFGTGARRVFIEPENAPGMDPQNLQKPMQRPFAGFEGDPLARSGDKNASVRSIKAGFRNQPGFGTGARRPPCSSRRACR